MLTTMYVLRHYNVVVIMYMIGVYFAAIAVLSSSGGRKSETSVHLFSSEII